MLTVLTLPIGSIRSVHAQKISYEGMTVIRIEISAQPPIKESQLRPLIAQREGEPYSSDKIHASIAALYNTGRFHDIQVDVKLEANGIILTFILQPTFYIGIIDVTGVEKAFTPNRVIEASNLPFDEVYTQDKITDSITQLDQFFKKNGYFDAKVHPNVRFDELTRRANIVFDVQLNHRANIGQVIINVANGLDVSRLRRAMKLKSGKAYTTEKLERAEDRLRKDLAKRNFLASSIHLVDRKYQPATNTVDLTYEINPGLPVEITAEGAKLSKKQLRKLVPVYEEASADRDLIEEGHRNIISYYQTKGYFDADAAVQVQRNSRVGIDYRIQRGEKHKIERITFTGNSYFTDEYLAEQIPIRTGHFLYPGLYNEDLLRRSTDNITALYRQRGYEEVKVTSSVDDKDARIDINFHIEPGPRTVVDSLEIQGNQAFSRDVLLRQIKLQPRQPFSEKLLVDDRDHILAYYYNEGFPNAHFDSQVTRLPEDPHRVRVAYRIDEGNRVRIEEVFVTGNRQTKEEYIKDSVDLRSGQPLSLGALLEQESKLYSLGIFEQVQIVPRQPITDQKSESLVVKVREAKRYSLSYSLGFEANRRPRTVPAGGSIIAGSLLNARVDDRTFLGPRATFDLSRRNMRGLGETATLGARLSRLQKRGIFTYADPHFWRSRWASLFTLFGERNSEIRTFTATRYESSFQLEKHPSQITTLLFRYSYRRVGLSDIRIPLEFVPRASRAVRLSTVSTSWIRDSRDRPLDASTGKFFTADFGLTPKIIGSKSDYIRFLGQAAHYRPVFGSSVWANSIRLGIAKPFGGTPEIPLSERFYAGGATTLRGFATNEAGPQQLLSIPDRNIDVAVPIGGDLLLILNTELRFPLPLHFLPQSKNLGGVVFYDGGNIYNKWSRPATERVVSRGYTNTIGFGLRFKTPVGPVRFDLGRNLNPIPGVSRTQFFITLGQAF